MPILNILLLSLMAIVFTGCSDTPDHKYQATDKGIISATIGTKARLAAFSSSTASSAVIDLHSQTTLFNITEPQANQKSVQSIKFNKNASILVATEKKHVKVIKTSSGKTLLDFELPFTANALNVNDSGSKILVGLVNGQALLVDIDRQQTLQVFEHGDTINSVAISHDDLYVLTGGDNNKVIVWDPKNGKKIHQIVTPSRVTQVAFSAKNDFFITACTYNYVRLYDTRSGNLKHTLNTPKVSINALKFSEDGQYLALGVMPQQIQLWQINGKPTKLQTWTLAKPSFWKPTATLVYALGFDFKNNYLLAIDTQGYVTWWYYPFTLT